MNPRAAILFILLLMMTGWPSSAFSDGNPVDLRESAVDRALGGMEEGSRMPAPEGSFRESGRKLPDSLLNPTVDMRTGAGATVSAGSQAPAPQALGGFGAAGGLSESTVPDSSESTVGGGGSSGEENLGAGSNELSVSEGSGGENLGSGIGGGLEPEGGTETSAGPSGGSIIDIDADVNLSGGEVDANLDAGINTEADSLLELDATSDVTMDTPVAAEVDSTESAVIETDLGIEEGINEAPASGEVEAGIEADVDASGESDEPIDNPADGLSL